MVWPFCLCWMEVGTICRSSIMVKKLFFALSFLIFILPIRAEPVGSEGKKSAPLPEPNVELSRVPGVSLIRDAEATDDGPYSCTYLFNRQNFKGWHTTLATYL